MKIDFIEMAGFRGIRENLRLEFSKGFTVITGRNGVGKSTVCDAIEFAITGAIRKYRVDKAKGESFHDYIWWRGNGSASKHYVKLGLVNNDGQSYEVSRTREDGLIFQDEQLVQLLCTKTGAPKDPLVQICKTSIIRDEWIASQSLDLKETERSELVNAALGELETAELGEKAQSVLKHAVDENVRAEKAYNEVRSEITTALSSLAEERSRVLSQGNVEAALKNISAVISDLPETLSAAIEAARAYLSEAQRRENAITNLAGMVREISGEIHTIRSDEFLASKQDTKNEIDRVKGEQARVTEQISSAILTQEALEANDSLSTALAHILEGGEVAGLDDGKCPLCAAPRTDEEFNAGLELVRNRVGELSDKISEARNRLETLDKERELINSQLTSAMEKLEAIEIRESSIKEKENHILGLLSNYDLSFESLPSTDLLLESSSSIRSEKIDIERNLTLLESSYASSRMADVEDKIRHLRDTEAELLLELGKRKLAVANAKEFDHAVKRIAGEIMDERLAAISPLLKEFYQRLRPHSDWKSIEFSIRGEVQKLLSLKVGQDLNPQFVFSSGQRRIAGIAFLLSVHLARPWCTLNTLILDDPVQHIDDFRAVHLAELLFALGRDDHQIICTVEDPSLAALLCRRLSRTLENPGRQYDLSRSQTGSALASGRDIAPVPTNIVDFPAQSH